MECTKEYKNTIDAIQRDERQLVSVADVYDTDDFDKYDGYNTVETKNYFDTKRGYLTYENNVFPRNDIPTKFTLVEEVKVVKNGRIKKTNY